MKGILFTILLCFGFAAHCQELQLRKIDTTHYFDFWVGKWKATYDEGTGVQQYGINTIDKILDGTVVRETFELDGGQNKGFKGTSISVYQPQLKRWKQAWADNQGGYFDFEGEFVGDKRIFKTQIFQRGEKQIQQRMVFYNIKDDSFTWDWELSSDGGQTWALSWRILYVRME
jgi:hypothetical protein